MRIVGGKEWVEAWIRTGEEATRPGREGKVETGGRRSDNLRNRQAQRTMRRADQNPRGVWYGNAINGREMSPIA